MVAAVKSRNGSVPAPPSGPDRSVVDPPNADTAVFMPEGTPFDFGTVYDPDAVSRTVPPSGSEAEQVAAWWPLFCEECGFVSSSNRIPTLLSWTSHGEVEVFEIALTGKFAAPMFEQAISVSLKKSRHAVQLTTSISRSVLTVALSHFELPWPLPFDLDRIPESDDQVYVGQLGEGSDGVWDTLGNSNLAIVGMNGGGKSEAVETILAQFHMKNWLIVVATPYENDPAFEPFRRRGHMVLDGLGPEAVARNMAAFPALVDVFEERSVQRSEAGTKWWGLPPRNPDFEGWRGRKILVVWEESGEFLQIKPADSEALKKMKMLAMIFNGKLAAQGRKNRMHGIWINQQPLVERFGGGDGLREIGARLALGYVDQSYHHILFQTAKGQSPNPAIGEILLDRNNPAGRGIMTGCADTGSKFPLQDVVVQVAYADDDGRADILAGGSKRAAAAADGDVIDVEVSAPAIVADVAADSPVDPGGPHNGVPLSGVVEVEYPDVDDGDLSPPAWMTPTVVGCSFAALLCLCAFFGLLGVVT